MMMDEDDVELVCPECLGAGEDDSLPVLTDHPARAVQRAFPGTREVIPCWRCHGLGFITTIEEELPFDPAPPEDDNPYSTVIWSPLLNDPERMPSPNA